MSSSLISQSSRDLDTANKSAGMKKEKMENGLVKVHPACDGAPVVIALSLHTRECLDDDCAEINPW